VNVVIHCDAAKTNLRWKYSNYGGKNVHGPFYGRPSTVHLMSSCQELGYAAWSRRTEEPALMGLHPMEISLGGESEKIMTNPLTCLLIFSNDSFYLVFIFFFC
jgi:hypothetical protein